MSYIEKILELIAIEHISDKTTITIKFTLEKEVELKWDIDNFTANGLNKIDPVFHDYKYRLSYNSFWDSKKNQFFTCCTKTYLDMSERIYFPCSEVFVKDLESIKKISSLKDLNLLSSSFTTLTDEEGTQDNKDTILIKKTPTRVRLTVATISIIATLLMGNSVHLYDDDTAYAKRTVNDTKVSNSVIFHNEQNIVDSISTTNSKFLISDSSTDVNNEKTGPSIPTVSVDKRTIFSIPKGKVALTFDDGPSKYTKEIADILTKYKVGGTFFFVGQNIKKSPDLVQYVDSKGFSIGNHSMNHADFSNLSYEEQRVEIIATNYLIEELISKPVTIFRPPYEAKKQSTIALLDDLNMKMVLWNKDPKDWKVRNSNKVYSYVVNNTPSGSIILFHESQVTINALPKIIEYLQTKDLQIVNLSN